MLTRWVAVLVLVLLAGMSWWDGRAPAPVGADSPADGFSAGRAMQTVEELAGEPRPAGSPAATRARDEIVDRLTAAGLSTRLHSSTGVIQRDGRVGAAPVDNIVATLPGTDPTGAVVLAAHYDSVAGGPGAADDMSSVAAILEAVRALRTGPPLRNDLIVLITDAEEIGLLGAEAWVREELGPRPTVTLNFEARGVSGPSLMFQTSPGNAELVRAFAEAVPHPVGDSSLAEAYRILPNDTDLTRVLDAGRPGMNFAFVEQPIEYHTDGDSPANLSEASVQGHGAAALGLARVLGDRDLAPLDPAVSGVPPSDDVTYFRVAGGLVVYPGALVWPVAGLGLVAVAGAVLAGRRRGLLTVPRVLGAAGGVVLTAIAGTLASIGLWQVLVAIRPSYADTGPFLHRPEPVQLAAVALAVLLTSVWYLLVRRWAGRSAAAAGAALLLAVLGVVTAATLPGLSYLFAWPALGLGLGLLATTFLDRRPVAATVAVTVGAVPAVALLIPLGWDLFTLSGIADGIAAAVQVLTFAALTALLVPTGTPSPATGRGTPAARLAVPAGALAVAVALSATGLLLDRPDLSQPQSSHLSFLQNADTGEARWVSADTAPADWTAGYLADAEPAEVPAWPGPTPVRTGPAAPLPVSGPSAEIVERTPERLVVQVTSPRGAPTVAVRTDRPLPAVTVTPAGRPPVRADGALDEIQLNAVGPQGVRVELADPGPEPVTLTVSDLTVGLAELPGALPRPPELRGSPRSDSDRVVLTRTVSG
ncbi:MULTISPECIES: M20/M25/M40 family metallo-hydrolase [Pseudonocardia]|uniref:M20/M25/M40 family metallo-hydrolase n=1 Tax=Pseudonocardia TaxID=1847 RepID=UPI000F7B9CD3|nr:MULTISPECIES: M20/M25/M40 family metallo-hydrolase [Pseudonocardia]